MAHFCVFASQASMTRRAARNSAETVDLPRHIDHVSSLSNPFVKHLVRIRDDSSYREEAGQLLVVGTTPLRELCECAVSRNANLLEILLVLEGSTPRKDVVRRSKRIVHITEPVMRKLAGVKSSQAIESIGLLKLPSTFCDVAWYEDPAAALQKWCPEPDRLLILDGIQDPGNLGTLLRTAAAFAWDGVFLLPGCCDPFNDKAMRSCRGSCFRIPVACGSWAQAQSFADLNSMELYAASPREDGEDEGILTVEQVAKSVNSNALCLVLGSEGRGISDDVSGSCHRLMVPMPGNYESLNVAVVGGILMYSLMRK